MADETPQKRVLPARERRESAAKRRASSPPPVATPTPKKTPTQSSEPRQKRKYVRRTGLVQPPPSSTASTPPVAEEVLPTRVTSSKPLPTTRQKQSDGVSEKEYQSIADSAILAASLHRSRMQWLCDGIFQKYWTKPIKRKGVTDVPPNNPDQKSMQKLGNATITIEPHAFEVAFFTVRDPLAPLPYYRHPNQHTPKPAFPPAQPYGIYPPPPPPAVQVAPPQSNALSSQPPSQPSTPAVKDEAAASVNLNSVPQAPSSAPTRPEAMASSLSTPRAAPAGHSPKPNTDPVIQMLAARAATNSRLKELMKVVATSKASPEQLKEFQSHIDEFNAVVRRQEAERASREKERSKPGSAPPPTQSKPATPASSSPGAAHPARYNPAVGRVGALPPPASANAAPPSPYMGYSPPARPEPIIKHIVVEFTTNPSSNHSASPDRWLFPEYAVLDIRYGGLEMVCSFFVERKGSDIIAALGGGSAEEAAALEGRWKADEEYYQPVTVTVKANQHRTIETIARAAKPLTAVQEHMKEVMKNKTRAQEEFLVHRLPREKALVGGEETFVDSAVELGSEEEDDEVREWYGNV